MHTAFSLMTLSAMGTRLRDGAKRLSLERAVQSSHNDHLPIVSHLLTELYYVRELEREREREGERERERDG